MANWIIQHQESAPDRLVIASYIGSTPASTDLGRMLHRIISEIQDYWKVSKFSLVMLHILVFVDGLHILTPLKSGLA
jgi:hypothetical protein